MPTFTGVHVYLATLLATRIHILHHTSSCSCGFFVTLNNGCITLSWQPRRSAANTRTLDFVVESKDKFDGWEEAEGSCVEDEMNEQNTKSASEVLDHLGEEVRMRGISHPEVEHSMAMAHERRFAKRECSTFCLPVIGRDQKVLDYASDASRRTRNMKHLTMKILGLGLLHPLTVAAGASVLVAVAMTLWNPKRRRDRWRSSLSSADSSSSRWPHRMLCRVEDRGEAGSPVSGEGYEGLIGNTPMVRLRSISAATGCDVLVKVEYLNPGGTSKDRIAASMISEAEASGALKPGGTVVEGTSGSTGICLASLCRAKGYRCTIVMPDDQADEKVELLKTFGAEVVRVRTASISSPEHYINVAARLAHERPGAVFMDQFETTANMRAHLSGTGPEIWRQTSGRLDAFVMGAGTGGCLAGVSLFLRKMRSRAKVYLVDPPGSALYNRVRHGVCYTPQMSERQVRRHRYDTIAEGIGNDHVTSNFAMAIVNDAFKVTDQEAVYMAHFLLRHEGLFVGCSSAMNCVGAALAARKLGRCHIIVTVLCDSGVRHLSRFWNKEFVEGRGLKWPGPGDTVLDSLDFIESRS